MNNVFKGNLYYADLEPVVGSEQGGVRPVLIVSNNIGNRYSSTVIIVPLTSKVESKIDLPMHVFIKAFGKIKNDSIVLVEQVRVVDKQRLKSFLGRLPNNQLMEVDKSLIVVFGMKENWEELL